MKRLLIPVLLSVSIHGLLMGLDTNWLNLRPPATPHPHLISVSLVTLPSRGDKRPAAAKPSPGDSEKKARTVEEKTARPANPSIQQIPKTPARQETTTPAIKPLVESFSPKKDKPVRVIKPKISLKKATQKPPRKKYPQAETQTKPQKNTKPAPQTDAAGARMAAQTPTQPTRSGGGAAAEGSPVRESTTLATKGDTSARAALTLARPLYRKNPAPRYPRLAKKRGYEGMVILEVLVNKKGAVEDLRVFESSGYDILDEAARSAVKKWAFEPGNRGGRATKMWVRVPVRFKLNK